MNIPMIVLLILPLLGFSMTLMCNNTQEKVISTIASIVSFSVMPLNVFLLFQYYSHDFTALHQPLLILYNQRKVILDKVKQNESDYEKKSKFAYGVNDSMEGMGLLQAVGLEASTPLEEANQNIQQLRKTSSSQIQSMPDKYRDLALREVTIKSSFNSALS